MPALPPYSVVLLVFESCSSKEQKGRVVRWSVPFHGDEVNALEYLK